MNSNNLSNLIKLLVNPKIRILDVFINPVLYGWDVIGECKACKSKCKEYIEYSDLKQGYLNLENLCCYYVDKF